MSRLSIAGVPYAASFYGPAPVMTALLFVGFVRTLATRINDSAVRELKGFCLVLLGMSAIAFVLLPVMARRPGIGIALLSLCLLISTILSFIRLLQAISMTLCIGCGMSRSGRMPTELARNRRRRSSAHFGTRPSVVSGRSDTPISQPH